MYRKFIATIAASAIALTALGSIPAYAGERDNARLIAAILGLAAVGAIVHKNKSRDKHEVTRNHPAPIYKAPKHQHPKQVQRQYTPPRYHQPKPRPLPQRAQKANRKLLPKQCFRTYDTNRGRVAMFANRCLKRNFQFAHRLPRNCMYIFDTPQGDRRGFDARCLRDRGYRLARG